MPTRKLVLGLIGGIGSGKSRVAEELKRHGGCIVSGDQLGHDALRVPEIRDRVVGRFGAGMVGENGEINRKKLGRMVFACETKRRDLEAIVFPFIGRRLREEIDRSQANAVCAFVVVDAAVMLEAGWNDLCTHVLFVSCPREIRLDRVARQRGWSDADLSARERAQMPLEEKQRRADWVISNAGDEARLRHDVEILMKSLVGGNE